MNSAGLVFVIVERTVRPVVLNTGQSKCSSNPQLVQRIVQREDHTFATGHRTGDSTLFLTAVMMAKNQFPSSVGLMAGKVLLSK
ncbi:MAG: hypothetical protein ACR2PG_08610 [Hyphomicrobiaceae bacterium]